MRDDGPSAVTSQTLNHTQDYVTSISLFDSLLRARQTQTDTANGARLLTETLYDTHGRVEEERGPHYNAQAPDTTLVTVPVGQSARRTEYRFDGAGRLTDQTFFNKHVERWRTTTSYGGSSDGYRVTVQPPNGAPATATITNARGHTTEKRTYRSHTPTGAYDSLTYDYTPTGQLESLTDEAGNVWSWQYDLRGRETVSNDPDAGTTTMSYDAAGQLIEMTDARGETLVYTYDALGRKLTRHDGQQQLLAEWEYDTAINGVGMLGKATRWYDGQAYINEIRAVNPAGLVTQEAVTLPTATGPLAGTHFFTRNYHPNGQVAVQGLPDLNGATERATLARGYDHVGNPTRLTYQGQFTGVTAIVDDATYTPFNELMSRTLGASYAPRQAWHGFVYEEDTRRLERSTFDRQASIHTVSDVRYTYDDAGNITSIADVPAGLPANHELQCFQYDPQRRLVEAWAQGDTSGCLASPSVGILGGPAPYWHSYAHDVTGNRTGETLRTPGQSTQVRDYHYPGRGQPQPHTLRQITTTGGSGGQASFGYDPAGNTTVRTIDAHSQTLDWDAEGRLGAVTENAGTTAMIYTADGDRLVRDDGDTVTVFLPETEAVWHRGTDQVDVTRYFDHAGQVVAICTGLDVADWTWMGVDHHGTTTTHSVNAFSGVSDVRRLDPYGNSRGAGPQTWPGQQHFVGGVEDPTGLVHIGVRSYDPVIGRFITIDPVLDVADDQQINGYTYANNNPITYTDPTGLLVDRFCVDVCGSNADRYLNPSTAAQQTGPVEPGAPGVSLNQTAGHLGWGPYDRLDQEDQQFVQEATFRTNNPTTHGLAAGGPLGWEAGDYDIVSEILGAADAHRCWQLEWSGCAWTVVAVTPLKPIKWTKLALLGSGAARTAARNADNAPWHAVFCSFSQDTDVLMADGTTKPIAELEPGDMVWATDPETGHEGPQPVLAIWVHHDTLIDLELETGQTVSTTAGHPFWNHTRQQWQPAHTLPPGDQLLTPTGNTPTITGLDHTTSRHGPAHNLTIANTHTYYVLAGDTPVLVHNTCWSMRRERAGDLGGRYTPAQSTRDPASQWYHEELSNDDLLRAINNAASGDGIVVSRSGTILGGHHRWDELQRRITSGRIDADTLIRIDVYG